MKKEFLIGIALAALAFAVIQGVDPTPFLVLAGVAFMLRMMLDGKGMGSRFELAGGPRSAGAWSPVTFADIGGQEVAKREFVEALELIQKPEKAAVLGIRPIKGILLVGPPGTGKTLLAKAAANFVNSAFIAVSGSQFVEMYAGVGAQRIRKIFRDARALAEAQHKKHAIIFFDEIEVLGGKRGSHAGHLEYDQTLNELLVQMDGISTDHNAVQILVVAATNRADLLDPALLRPGRFDRTVHVDLPDKEGRLHILKIHARKHPLDETVNLEDIARDTYGFSGAHLEAVMNEAAILAMRSGRDRISVADLHEAMDKVQMGEKLDRRPTEDEKQRIAFHEAGHALISEMVRPGSVSTINITPRGMAMGYMRQAPDSDRYIYTKQDILDQMAVCLGGAVAEELCLGSRSTGAAGDFKQALNLAERLIRAGLSDLGVVDPDILPAQVKHEEQKKLIQSQEEYVKRQIVVCKDKLHDIALQLLAEEKMTGEEFRDILGETMPLVLSPPQEHKKLEHILTA
ncbi:MAG TPA: AAA family ATPase [Firmicutes bacterium]|jgi:cell division protease FtsH|nr:AAA family ATPase [Bacillota bacterium]